MLSDEDIDVLIAEYSVAEACMIFTAQNHLTLLEMSRGCDEHTRHAFLAMSREAARTSRRFRDKIRDMAMGDA